MRALLTTFGWSEVLHLTVGDVGDDPRGALQVIGDVFKGEVCEQHRVKAVVG